MKSEPKKDDKQRIIAQQKGIKSNIVNRQTKQIIRQSKAKLNNAGDNEESKPWARIMLLGKSKRTAKR